MALSITAGYTNTQPPELLTTLVVESGTASDSGLSVDGGVFYVMTCSFDFKPQGSAAGSPPDAANNNPKDASGEVPCYVEQDGLCSLTPPVECGQDPFPGTPVSACPTANLFGCCTATIDSKVFEHTCYYSNFTDAGYADAMSHCPVEVSSSYETYAWSTTP
jgi:hypothetical protein